MVIQSTVCHCEKCFNPLQCENVKNVLILFNVEKFLYKVAYFAGATKIILITSENRELFSVDEFRFCKSKNVSNYEEKARQPNT